MLDSKLGLSSTGSHEGKAEEVLGCNKADGIGSNLDHIGRLLGFSSGLHHNAAANTIDAWEVVLSEVTGTALT